MYYKLVRVNTVRGKDQQSWILHLPSTVGRSSDHEVCIDDESISRSHCRFSLNGDGALVVRDLNSMNGTYLDDKKIAQAVLKPGDVIQVGAVTLRVEYTSETNVERPTIQRKSPGASSAVTTRMTTRSDSNDQASSPEQPKKWWQFW
jgi:pSer/pThr/pTyr-binding forkhead associated (FHA) protein